MYKGYCRYLTIPRLGAACRKPGPGERTSFHRNGVGPAPPGRANGMSQASRPDPGERTPLQRSDVGTAPPSRAKGHSRLKLCRLWSLPGTLCHFLVRPRASMQFPNSVRVYIWFSPKPEYFCYFFNGRGISANFPTIETFMQFLHLSRVFLQFSGQQRDFLAILHPPGIFLQWTFSVIFPSTGVFLQFWTAEGLFCNFLLHGDISAIFWAAEVYVYF
ncbi:hypothetical protein Taro_010314 [Colocasia esculenta]|uniref:Uncharacterized protein n=1 Tax=Colocasia esculenta TaxID=4460 RepID=A0A843U7A1_COLES|nr:hypothetical protein [Colocasia esculenta]